MTHDIILRNSYGYGPGHHPLELILISVIEILELFPSEVIMRGARYYHPELAVEFCV
ncbi:MAG: hypothetical protein K8R19_10135 [Methanosarcinales archaeon]|nr:hypothetical protein [Methanosarcinales archaeon]